VHIMYGMGKDFGATGLRIGVLQSANEGLIAAVSSIRYVTSPSCQNGFLNRM
jgi:aspartate/methionine/tyrosine aminotransferase